MCPPRDCAGREGPKWLDARLFREREAELQKQIDALLNFQIDRERAERDVTDIAQSEFFQSLAARAAQKRDRT